MSGMQADAERQIEEAVALTLRLWRPLQLDAPRKTGARSLHDVSSGPRL